MSREVIPAEPKSQSAVPGFFEYSQNNSGGSFKISESVTTHVVIEAHDADHANRIAEEIGIYFDGCDKGMDCSCCGDRWSQKGVWRDSKPDYASLAEVDAAFSLPQKESWANKDGWTKKGQPYGIVYLMDDSKVIYRKD